ncbi:MAG: hypothetical protein JW741_18140 [Sedimentisphaerales bacterium]|nr:hypothetical protein [Sedimentisphaerales bacterium]
MLAFLWTGCARHRLVPLAPVTRPAKNATAWSKPSWGPETEGLQCRLRPTKRLWHPNGDPSFKVDLRHRGKRIFAFDASEPLPLRRVVVDGREYPASSPPASQGRLSPLAPGMELTNQPVSLPRSVYASLATGPHTIQIVFAFEDVEVVSNRVAIEVARAP